MHITQDSQQKFEVKQVSLVKPDIYAWDSECGEKALPTGFAIPLTTLLSGHFKDSYGAEGMGITGKTDWKRIVNVSEM